ncbi:MAG TPA: hypothetical protein VJK26_02015 [Patescibacteria group bacterium]|nr:hypothetical protein [Patescibacteria group bacterium]
MRFYLVFRQIDNKIYGDYIDYDGALQTVQLDSVEESTVHELDAVGRDVHLEPVTFIRGSDLKNPELVTIIYDQ